MSETLAVMLSQKRGNCYILTTSDKHVSSSKLLEVIMDVISIFFLIAMSIQVYLVYFVCKRVAVAQG